VDAQPDVVFAEEPQQPDLPEPDLPAYDPLENARKTLSAQMQLDTDQPLLSRTASVAVDSAFASLAHTVLSQNARTLDDLVKEMLRPMLKSWLDDNLPSLVERLVRAEIERVSRGR
jgi:cell pole-organizing protein PopZ